MDHLHDALDAVIGQLVQVVVAGFGQTVADHGASRERGDTLRDGAAAQALLGPTLDRFAQELLGKLERKTIARYAAYRQHPTYSAEQLINEAEDADRTLNVAIVAAATPGTRATGGGNPWVRNLALEVAILRVRAITSAIGPDCIYPEPDASKAGRSGPRQRRRPITAADIPAEIADILVRGPAGDGDPAAAIAGLKVIERSEANAGSLVTKLLALFEQPDGQRHLNTIVTALRRAQFGRQVDMPSEAARPIVPPPLSPPKRPLQSSAYEEPVAVPISDRVGDRSPDPDPPRVPQKSRERARRLGVTRPSATDFINSSHAHHRKPTA